MMRILNPNRALNGVAVLGLLAAIWLVAAIAGCMGGRLGLALVAVPALIALAAYGASVVAETERARHRAQAHAEAQWLDYLGKFDGRMWSAITQLCEAPSAAWLWKGLGPATGYPTPLATSHRDDGIHATKAGAQVRLMLPRGWTTHHVAVNLPELAHRLGVAHVNVVSASLRVLVLELHTDTPAHAGTPAGTW